MSRLMVNISFVLALLFFGIILNSCKEDTINPEILSSLSGTVLDSENNTALKNVSITTSPPTSAILTNSNGKFTLTDIPVGNYLISATKSGYLKANVNISVRESYTAQANIFMQKDTSNNVAPGLPISPSPVNGAVNLPVEVQLNWNAIDPDEGDSLFFDIYLYESNNSSQNPIATNVSDTFYTVKSLDFNTEFFWQIIVKDGNGHTVNGNVWSFTTMEMPDYPFTYSTMRDGNYEIYISDTSQASFTRLTNNTSRDWWPVFNDRGDKIAFSSNRDITNQIYTMNPDGSGLYRVTTLPMDGYHNNGKGFDWSPDGGKFVYSRFDGLFTIDVNGANLTQIAQAPAGRNFRECSWSPLGDKIIALTIGQNIYDNEIYIINSDGSNMNLLVDNMPGIIESPSFTIDGTEILFTRDVSGFEVQSGRQLNSHIFLMNIDKSDTLDLSQDKTDGTNDLYPRISPSGAKVIFTNTSNTGTGIKNIYMYDFSSDSRFNLISNAEMPDWR